MAATLEPGRMPLTAKRLLEVMIRITRRLARDALAAGEPRRGIPDPEAAPAGGAVTVQACARPQGLAPQQAALSRAGAPEGGRTEPPAR